MFPRVALGMARARYITSLRSIEFIGPAFELSFRAVLLSKCTAVLPPRRT